MRKKMLAVALAGAICGYLIGRECRDHGEQQPLSNVTTDTVVTVRTDTLTIVRPQENIRRHTDTLTLYSRKDEYTTSFEGDTPVIKIPREEKVYADSSYRAVISGVDVRLDSITVWPRTVTLTLTQRKNERRWVIGPSVGLMWNGHSLSPSIGISLTYRFASF